MRFPSSLELFKVHFASLRCSLGASFCVPKVSILPLIFFVALLGFFGDVFAHLWGTLGGSFYVPKVLNLSLRASSPSMVPRHGPR